MKLADEANLAAESLLGSVDAQRFLEQLRAPRLMEEMTRTPQNGTIPRFKPCDELSRTAAPASDAVTDEPQSNASCLSSEALRP